MGIVVKKYEFDREELTCPVAICDVCGEIITDGREGMYMWQKEQVHESTGAEIIVVHKGDCSRQYAHHLNDPLYELLGDEELINIAPFLGNNLDVDWEKAKEDGSLIDPKEE